MALATTKSRFGSVCWDWIGSSALASTFCRARWPCRRARSACSSASCATSSTRLWVSPGRRALPAVGTASTRVLISSPSPGLPAPGLLVSQASSSLCRSSAPTRWSCPSCRGTCTPPLSRRRWRSSKTSRAWPMVSGSPTNLARTTCTGLHTCNCPCTSSARTRMTSSTSRTRSSASRHRPRQTKVGAHSGQTFCGGVG